MFKKDRPWSHYPTGALARSMTGGHWCKVKAGWKWNGPEGSGGTFPTPGADWFEIILPPEESAMKVRAELGHAVRGLSSRPEVDGKYLISVWIERDGKHVELMLSEEEIGIALARAERTPEASTDLDFPPNPLNKRVKELEYIVDWWKWRSKPWWMRLFVPCPQRTNTHNV